MAQMTQYTSSGPVFVVAGLRDTYFVVYKPKRRLRRLLGPNKALE